MGLLWAAMHRHALRLILLLAATALPSGLREMLLQSEHRTLDPEEADFFYIPVSRRRLNKKSYVSSFQQQGMPGITLSAPSGRRAPTQCSCAAYHHGALATGGWGDCVMQLGLPLLP